MKFGEKLLQSRYEPWLSYYLDYDELKRLLKEQQDDADQYPPPPSSSHVNGGLMRMHRSLQSTTSTTSLIGLFTTTLQTSQGLGSFIVRLNEQVERILIFFLQEQALIATELQDCRRQQAKLQQQQPAATATTETGEAAAWSVALLASSHDTTAEQQQQPTHEELALFHQFYRVAVHLLRLIQFVDLNMTGLRKILKKHDKLFHGATRLSQVYLGRRAVVLQPLVSHDSLDALTKLFESALKEWTEFVRERHYSCVVEEVDDPQLLQWSSRSIEYHPTTTTTTAPSPAFSTNMKKSWSFVTLAPQTHHDLETVFGGFAKQDTDMNKIKSSKAILFQIKAARSRLQATSELQQMLAAPIMVLNNQGGERETSSQGSPLEEEEDTLEDEPDGMMDGTTTSSGGGGDRDMSNFLNYFSTFLYMANYYIVAPASNTYAEKLGGTAAQAGIIIGMTPVAALVSTLLYSWWTSYSYKSALIFASVCSCIGNLCYGLGLPLNSLTLVLVGRLWNGFGSARSINRRYIADSYSRRNRTAASATFVTAGALGCSMGPAIAAFLEFAINDEVDEFSNPYWQVENAPGWIMFVVWTIYLVVLIVFFQDPPRRRRPRLKKEPKMVDGGGSGGETQPLLLVSSGNAADADAVAAPMEITVIKKGTCASMYEYIPVIVPFTIYFILKLILESTLSSIPMITHHYFKWTGQSSGTYLAILGLMLLPANAAVSYLSASYDDRTLVVGIQLCMTVGCFSMLNYNGDEDMQDYSLIQYLIATVLCYVSTSALEGPNMSLLSKTIPKSWSEGFFNIGLLATEAGTLGRAVADVLLTACGGDGMDHVLNRMFGICSGLSLGLLALSLRFYSHLVPRVEHDDL